MTELRPGIESAIQRIAEILCEAATASGMSRDEVQDLKQAFRDLVSATLRGK